jgi:hypothetical protein
MAFEPDAAVFDRIAPHPEGVDASHELAHERAYVVRSYIGGPDLLIIRGAIRDQKPPGLYVPEDPEPLTMHHMVVDLHISVPSLVITKATAVLEVHPHSTCKNIEPHYGNLVGLSIARGFTHKVRELFGGPRGCTHTTALLQAMAPVAIQSMWSFRMRALKEEGGFSAEGGPFGTPEARERSILSNLNTCHVWDEEGEHITAIRNGAPIEVPASIAERLAKLGRDPRVLRN